MRRLEICSQSKVLELRQDSNVSEIESRIKSKRKKDLRAQKPEEAKC